MLYRTLVSSYANYQENKSFKFMEGKFDYFGGSDIYFVFFNGDREVDTMPTKDSGLVLDTSKTNCTNGASIKWDSDNWAPQIINLTTPKTKCSLYFGEPSESAETTLARLQALNNTIKLNESMNSNSGTCPTVNDDGTVNVTAIEQSASLLCEAPDEYGTSYYFRGNVTNNYVSFAGAIWRIIRINGDGSIRMIYDGTTAYDNIANGESTSNGANRQIGTKAFNSTSNRNAYVGYMYKNAEGDSYSNTFNMVEENKSSLISSTIKGSASDATTIDGWYKANIADKNLEGYIADNLFCNDKNFAPNNTGTGITTRTTSYRWSNGPWTSGANQNKPRLTCQNTTNLVDSKNDAFTVSDTEHGNGALTYPIALITTDEAVLAGGYSGQSYYYLVTGSWYWTTSSIRMGRPSAIESYVYLNGHIDGTSFNVGETVGGVRPVLSLAPNVQFTNSSSATAGTKDEPLVVKVN